MSEPGFTISVSQNKFLAPDRHEMHAALTVTGAGLGRKPGPDTAGPQAAEVILVDCSGSMDYPPSKISAARRATRAAIDALRDGVLFGVVAGTSLAQLAYPNKPHLVPASKATRADAKIVVDRLRANGGTAMGTWLTMADALLGQYPTAIRHALLFTDGQNRERPGELSRVLDDVRGRFVCDVRGIGDDWEPAELLRIAATLNGQAIGVARLADMAADFEALMLDVMRKVVPDVDLRLRLINRARLTYFKQLFPTDVDLTDQLSYSGELDIRLATGSWADETREYQIGIDVAPTGTDDDMTKDVRIARVDLAIRRGDTISDEKIRPGQVFVRWTDDATLITRIPEAIATYDEQRQIADAIRDGCEAYNAGKWEIARAQFTIAHELATRSRNDEMLKLLDTLVTSVAGEVKLREEIQLSNIISAILNSHQSQFSGRRQQVANPVPAGPPKKCDVCERQNRGDAIYCERCSTPFPGQRS
ncbi:MAG TPA: VWA domain-containing protein [Pseudonocardiaceae bacterium]|jgi:Ca-activated chloride channel family protein|nr:VWA domain-containing protein [Pseudonocardiaceae bacterium]